MLGLSTPILAAAYLLILGPSQVDQAPLAPEPDHVVTDCQRPAAAPRRPAPYNHISVRWRGWDHHRHCERVRHHWRCR
jgi:hypothetical protein